MNNYCTKCGRKLDEEAIWCADCKLGVVDIPKPKRKFISKKYILGGIGVFFVAFLLFWWGCMNKMLSITRGLLVNTNYTKIKVTKVKQCRRCAGSCDGACYHTEKVFDCYDYYLDIFLDNDVIKAVVSYQMGGKSDTFELEEKLSQYKVGKMLVENFLYDNLVYDKHLVVNLSSKIRNNLTVDFIKKLFLFNNALTARDIDLVELKFPDGFKINVSGFSAKMTLTKDGDDSKILSITNLSQINDEKLNLADDRSYKKILNELEQWVRDNA